MILSLKRNNSFVNYLLYSKKKVFVDSIVYLRSWQQMTVLMTMFVTSCNLDDNSDDIDGVGDDSNHKLSSIYKLLISGSLLLWSGQNF